MDEQEDSMYMCKCCKSVLSREEYPPENGMCPECHKSRSEDLTILYHNVERVLSHALQPVSWETTPGIGHRNLIEQVTNARTSLRNIMRNMGWKGQF